MGLFHTTHSYIGRGAALPVCFFWGGVYKLVDQMEMLTAAPPSLIQATQPDSQGACFGLVQKRGGGPRSVAKECLQVWCRTLPNIQLLDAG